MYGQLIDLLDKRKVLDFSRTIGSERYVKSFDAWQHLLVMLYAVIKRLDSLREISASMYPEANKLAHIGLTSLPRRSTLSDANARRSEKVFERVYRDLYQTYKDELSSDSRKRQNPKWFDKLQIIDSTTISLFSNLVFQGVGRHPKTGKKKGGVKAHTIIHANEGVPSDIKFTSAATNDSFMLQPAQYAKGDIVALDRAYIDYEKFETLTRNGVTYVTKLKKKLKYTVQKDVMYMNDDGHMEMEAEDIVDIYRKWWEIELLYKQLKQNFPLRYFYGESANAIKIQIWVTLIANLLLMVVQKRVRNRSWSFSGLATIIRITLMYYINCYSFLNNPDKDWEKLIEQSKEPPIQLSLFD